MYNKMRVFHNSVVDASLGPTDLRGTAMQDAIDIKVLQTLGMARETRSVVTVARGPVPRDLSTFAENARSPETTEGCC